MRQRRVPGLQLPIPLRTQDLLLENARAAALEHVRSADDTTQRRWRDEAQRLVRSMNAGALDRSTEVALQGAFLDAVFSRLLGYSSALAGIVPFTLTSEISTEIDATEADGALGWFTTPGVGRTLAVVELKDARTNLDRRQLSRRDRTIQSRWHD